MRQYGKRERAEFAANSPRLGGQAKAAHFGDGRAVAFDDRGDSWPRAIMCGVMRTSCVSAPDIREGVITWSTRRGFRHWESGVEHELNRKRMAAT